MGGKNGPETGPRAKGGGEERPRDGAESKRGGAEGKGNGLGARTDLNGAGSKGKNCLESQNGPETGPRARGRGQEGRDGPEMGSRAKGDGTEGKGRRDGVQGNAGQVCEMGSSFY
jgi:hypothetical protein